MNKRIYVFWVLAAVVLLVVAGCANKWVTSGKIAMNSKNWDKAITDFNKAIEENPDNAVAHMYLARCYLEKDEYDKMPPHLDAAEKVEDNAEKVEDLRKEAWRDLFEAGRDNAKNEKYEEAKIDFNTAVVIYPVRYEALSNLGFVWQHLENSDSSYYYYGEAYKASPDEKSVIANYAGVCFNLEKVDQAEELYTKLLTIDPDDADANLRMGDIMIKRDKTAEAVVFYEKALELEPDNCNLWFNVGLVYIRDFEDFDKAISSFNRVLEICPDDIDAHINLAVALIQAEKFDEAVGNLSAFTEEYPDECVGWDLYSRALLQAGNRKDALEANKKFDECSNK